MNKKEAIAILNRIIQNQLILHQCFRMEGWWDSIGHHTKKARESHEIQKVYDKKITEDKLLLLENFKE